jgi:hypothetical protein
MSRDYIVSAFSRLREAVEDRDVPSDSGHLFALQLCDTRSKLGDDGLLFLDGFG